MNFLKIVFSCLILATLFSSLVLPLNASSAGVNSSLGAAEEDLSSAFEAAFAAEDAGANISVLLDTLNLAGEYLSDARAWYNLGDFEKTYDFIDLCNDALSGVSDDALELTDAAKTVQDNNLSANLALSFLGTFFSIIAGYFSWIFFKRRYYDKILESKVEEVPD